MPPVASPVVVDDAGTLRDRRRRENFPVALRLLPRATRRHLTAVYDVARTIDDVGDEPPGGGNRGTVALEGAYAAIARPPASDRGTVALEGAYAAIARPPATNRSAAERLAALDALEADLCRIWTDGRPQADVFRALAPTVRTCGLSVEPFVALIDANRLDQTCDRYPTWSDLRHYCRLSADPVGRIVLAIFGATSPDLVPRSDDVCTALQVLEHCQDVAEDRRRGRIYLPLEDLTCFDVAETDLDAPAATPQVRALVGFEVDRAARLLASGRSLVAQLHGWARIAVAGYVAGGLATVDALRRADYDVLSSTPRPQLRDLARHVAGLLARRA